MIIKIWETSDDGDLYYWERWFASWSDYREFSINNYLTRVSPLLVYKHGNQAIGEMK